MKIEKFALRYTALAVVLLLVFVSCDKDFASIESDIINRDNATNFNTDSQTYDVIAYTDSLGPVQTNGLPYQLLGFYDDQTFGSTTASFVTQVNSSSFDPTFGTEVEIDSVVLTIPFFSTNVGLNDDNEIEYRLDSIFPRSSDDNYSPIKLSIYENNYFLRDFDPNASFDTPQAYFSDKSLSTSEMISEMSLEGTLIHEEASLTISDDQIELWDADDEVTEILGPSIRIKLDSTYWKSKIIDQEGSSVLRNSNNFRNYFRGLFFKAESVMDTGSLMALNMASPSSNITIYYKDVSEGATDASQRTYTLTFGPNRVNFFDNSNVIANGDDDLGDQELIIKGGQGSVAGIKLFPGDNDFETFKNDFAYYDEDGEFESSRRLINEANLIFYVKQTAILGQEPNRLFLYDMDNNTPLIDYFFDLTSSFPAISRPNHLGILQRENDDPNGDGIKYKFRITEHIKNLIQNDSTNVRLGLSVSGNVNLEETSLQRIEQTMGNTEKRVPISSIISPRGTILYGSAEPVESNRVQLEIFYTCIEEECEEN